MTPQFAYIMNIKTSSVWHVNVLRIHILHVMKGSHASTMAQLRRYGQVQVLNSSV